VGLQNFWFVVIVFFWAGFFILEGFDMGVGALHMVVGKTDIERRVAINTIGPFWDGNEVWLIVAGAATFAAFPLWYASMFSSMYLALMLVILALIIRGVSFEYRGKMTSPRWRTTWDWMLTIGSVLLPVMLGIALGDLLHGLPINKEGNYTGTFWDLFTGYGVWTGLTLLAVSLAHGSIYLGLKTTGTVKERSERIAGPLAWVAALFVLGFFIWTHVLSTRGVLPNPIQIIGFLLAVGAAWAVRDGYDGSAFAATTALMGSIILGIFVSLHPNVMVSSTNSAYNLTVSNSASGHYTLVLMTIVALIFTPLVLAYQAWSYYVFRARVIGPAGNGPPATATAPTGVALEGEGPHT
jgi:cytochrome bd ubiquinol oxidase subunit II